MKVHHCENNDTTGFHGIQNAVRKALRLTASYVALQHSPRVRILHGAMDGGPDFEGEVNPKPLLTALVVVDGGKELRLCLWME